MLDSVQSLNKVRDLFFSFSDTVRAGGLYNSSVDNGFLHNIVFEANEAGITWYSICVCKNICIYLYIDQVYR